MRYFLVCLVFSVFNTIAQKPVLRINPKGHMAQIRDLAVSSDGKYIVTGSFDKSVKKWNRTTGEVELEFRGQIGYGAEGMVYYIELSPDDNYLAVGGWFGKDDETESLGDIRLYDFKTGEMIHVFKGLTNVPSGIGFSKDGTKLIAGDQASVINVWDIASKEKVNSLNFHSLSYEETLFRLVAEDDYVFSVDELGNIALWDITKQTDAPIATNTVDYKKYFTNSNGVLAISPTGNEFVISADNTLLFFNKKLALQHTLKLEHHPGFLKFNSTGEKLIHGNVGVGDENNCCVHEKNQKKWSQKHELIGHTDAVLAGDFISDETFVTAGGADDEIRVWTVNANSSIESKIFKGVGKSYFGVGISNEHLGLAPHWDKGYGFSTFTESFNLFMKKFEKIPQSATFNRSFWKKNTLSLSTYNSGDGVMQNSDLVISKKGKATDTITREWWFGDRHNCFSFTKGDFIISAGAQGVIEAYNLQGFPVSNFIGHEGDVWSISFNADSTKMITCSSDQTIRIWDLSTVGKRNSTTPPYSIAEYFTLMDIWEPFEKLFKKAKIAELAHEKTFDAWEKSIAVFKQKKYPFNFMEKKYYDFQYNEIHPALSVFISEDGEWVIWNKDGYFSSSLKGSQLVGFHVNHGQDNKADFYPFEQFDLKYNRPDIILKDLDIGYNEYIPLYFLAYKKRLAKMGFRIADMETEFDVPDLQVLESKRFQNEYLVHIKANDTKFNLNSLHIFNNDVPVFGRDGIGLTPSKKIDTLIKFELANGENNLSFSVLNENGTRSLNQYQKVNYSDQAQKTNLYIVALGVSKFEDTRYDLKYAAKDATDIALFFNSSENYHQIKTLSLINQQVTKENLDTLSYFLSNATVNDVVLFFLAGHGVLDENYNYYYATHDMDFSDPSKFGVSFSEIENVLDDLKSLKKLLLMDTCHSGEVDEDEVASLSNTEFEFEDVQFRTVGNTNLKTVSEQQKNISEMNKELFIDLRKGTGTTIISSAGGVEFAFESSAWNNGLFTFCLLNNLKNGKSDLDGDRVVQLSELRKTVQDEVYKLSKGFQRPTSRLDNIQSDFVIWTY